jgi:hypothetical protein
MGKSTISMAIFNSKLLVYQRVDINRSSTNQQINRLVLFSSSWCTRLCSHILPGPLCHILPCWGYLGLLPQPKVFIKFIRGQFLGEAWESVGPTGCTNTM